MLKRITVMVDDHNLKLLKCYQAELIETNAKKGNHKSISLSNVINMVLDKGFPKRKRKTWERS